MQYSWRGNMVVGVKESLETKYWSEVLPHIYQVKVPVPFSLKWVNSYLLLDDGKFVIIDPGLHTQESVACWEIVLQELDLSWEDCNVVFVTHQHPDHYGLAGYVQQNSGASVYMTEEAFRYTERLWGTGIAQFEQEMLQLLELHGTPKSIQHGILHNLREFVELVQPRPTITFVQEQESINLGKRSWRMIGTKGHAYGQVMLYDEAGKIMICGDQVLPKITPHVGVIAGEPRPVLDEFLTNLQEVAQYDVILALPGHRDPFPNFSERALQIIAHHERRLDKLMQYVEEQQYCDAFTCCEWLFGTHLRQNAHNMRFALSETIAHLEELVRQGRIQILIQDGKALFSKVVQ